MTRYLFSLLGVLLVVGCGGTTFVNKKYRGRLSSSNRLVIMPVEAHRFPKAMRPAIENLMNRELNNSFGSGALRVMHVKAKLAPAGYANLGWRLALGMHYRTKYKGDNKLDGDYYDWLDELPKHSRMFVDWLKKAMAGVSGSGGEMRYILTAYVERLENKKTKKGEPRISFRVMVGIFDVQRSRIVATTWKYLSARPHLDAITPLLKGMGAHARQQFGPVLQ